MTSLQALRAALRALASPERAKSSSWYFKTGPGNYGEGDRFIGLTVPQQRLVAKQFSDLPFAELEKLLASSIHEERQVALMILVEQTRKADDASRKEIYDFYFAHIGAVNNWDLVDGTAEQIVGVYLDGKSKAPLHRLAKSKNVWERRIAIVATFAYLKQRDAAEPLKIAEMLLRDEHDLIHKAVGWVLRETGKRCGERTLTDFLDAHVHEMPRTTLRYAIERFPEAKRLRYLKMKR